MIEDETEDNNRKSHITVLYRGVDITHEVGLCICNECLKETRDRIDKQKVKNDISHNNSCVTLAYKELVCRIRKKYDTVSK